MALNLIGYWKTALSDPYPLPQHCRGELSTDDRTKLARYLDAGSHFAGYRGISWCRYACGEPNMGSREVSDGVWAWPEGLAHYVRHHELILPPAFIEHALTGAMHKPFRDDSHSDEPEDIDDAEWLTWSRGRLPSDWAQRLEQARQRAAARAEEIYLDSAAMREAEQGLDSAPCITAGCTRRALRGVAFCGRCLAARDEFVQVDEEFRELTALCKAAE